jgi:hypothetical protein
LPAISMKFPTTVIAFGMFVLGRLFLGQLRINYLRKTSKDVSLDPSKEIVLRYAIWYYVYPVLGFGLAAFVGIAALHETGSLRVITYSLFAILCLVGGLWLFYQQSIARVKIVGGMLVYTEGSTRCEIGSNDVSRFSLNGFKFIVKTTSGKIAQIPATFESSEFIFAFLQNASKNYSQ